jgi:hypothetical protein
MLLEDQLCSAIDGGDAASQGTSRLLVSDKHYSLIRPYNDHLRLIAMVVPMRLLLGSCLLYFSY